MNNASEMPSLMFMQVGKYHFNKGMACDFTNIPRPFHTVALITKGGGDFIFGNTVISVKAGDIIFIPMRSTYMSKWYADESASVSIHFQFDIPTPFPNNRQYLIQKLSSGEYIGITDMFENIYREYNSEPTMIFSSLANFYNIINMLYSDLTYKKIKATNDRIKKAIDYINIHYNEKISVSFLASLCNMSVSHFHMCIKKQLDCSAIEYKHRVCIHHAELLLLENKKNIEEISEAVGFSSSIYFREIFKKITGKTPTEYRKIEY